MAFPSDPRDVELGIWINSAWVDAASVGNSIRTGKGATTIRCGRANWGSTADASTLSAPLDNRDGRWSPDKSDGAYAGFLQRNLPTRYGIHHGTPYLTHTDASADVISTPDHASLGITGDIDIRIDFELEKDLLDISDEGGKRVRLARQRASFGTAGWQIELTLYNDAPLLRLQWYDSGGTVRDYETLDLTAADTSVLWRCNYKRTALRFTLDVDNGASDCVGRFYWADTIGGPWNELGDGTGALGTGIGTTSIGNSTADLTVGGNTSDITTAFQPLTGRIYAFELRDGIDGTEVANPDFTAQTVAASSFADSAGRTWTLGTGGRISDLRWRFHGELTSLPVRWNIDGTDVWAPIDAAGLLRRVRQRDDIKSATRRTIEYNEQGGLFQYWSCEDAGSNLLTQFGATVGTSPLTIGGGVPIPADNDDYAASFPLPTLGTDVWSATVDDYTDNGAWSVRFNLSVPADFAGTNVTILRVETDVLDWVIQHTTTSNGSMRVIAYNKSGSAQHTHAYYNFNSEGKPLRVTFNVYDDGADVSYRLWGIGQGESGVSGFVQATAVSTSSAGVISQVKVNQDSDCTGITIGHITLYDDDIDYYSLSDEISSNSGETAANRIRRLCVEEGIAFRVYGNPFESETMGNQPPGTLSALLEECANTDLGILHDAPEALAIAYRPRQTMLAQGDRLEDPSNLVAWYSTGDVLTTDQTVIPNRVLDSGVDHATLGASTEAPTITLATASDFTRLDPDGTDDNVITDYTPTITATTGQLTVIFAGYWTTAATSTDSARIVSFEGTSAQSLYISTAGAATAHPRVAIGGTTTEVGIDVTSDTLANGDRFVCAAICNAGTLSVYYYGDGISGTTQDYTGVGTMDHTAGHVFEAGYGSDNIDVGGLEVVVVEDAMTEAALNLFAARLYNRTELGVVALDYTAGDLAASPEPDRDDQALENDITVRNTGGGGSARAVLADGSALSVSEPPVGSGRYTRTVDVSTEPGRLTTIAGRYLAQGTVDEPRISRLTTGLHHSSLAADSALSTAILEARIGDLVTVDNNLTTWSSAQISQTLQGWQQDVGLFEDFVSMLTTPASPLRFNEALALSAALTPTGTPGNVRGLGTGLTVTAPTATTGDTMIAITVAPYPLEVATPSYTPPVTGSTLLFDYPGVNYVNRMRAWMFAHDGSGTYTFGFNNASYTQSCTLIALDGVAASYDVTATPVVNVSTATAWPTVTSQAGDLVLAIAGQQTTDELISGPTGYTLEVNNTGGTTSRQSAAYYSYAVGSSTTPDPGTWDGSVSAHICWTLALRK